MLKGRVAALEQARRDNYVIDLENDVVVRAAPPLPLVPAPPVHHAALLAHVIGLFLSSANTIGPVVDLLALVLRQASRDR